MHNSQILTIEQMKAAEQALIDAGETVSTLMERAGRGAAEWIWRIAAGRSVTVMCGPGNNGGDGYVIARVLAERGLKVNVVAPLSPKTPAARAAKAAWGGEPVKNAKGGVFVDCLFGSGMARMIDQELETLLCELAAAHENCVAVDVPSGIDCDSGEVLNDTLPIHDLTIALGAWKFAHWMMPAMQLMGERRLVDIGVPQGWDVAQAAFRPLLAEPEPDAHKYSRGMLAVIGGEMPGAAVLAATAAIRGGAGYVKLFSNGDPGPVPPELVVVSDGLDELLSDVRLGALLVGPGLGRSKEARDRLAFVLGCDLPTVCDADALHLLTPDMLEGRLSPLIVTPHAGELDALGQTFGSVGLDRIEQVSDLAEALEGVVVAKGPDTMLAAPATPVTIMPPATSWLSTAGTGDVLAGLIASRMAVGMESPMGIALEGCWLHAEAARLAGPAFSAGDLVHHIPAAYRAML